jgi:hypothetical protein
MSYSIKTISGRGLPTGVDRDGYDTYLAASAIAEDCHNGEFIVTPIPWQNVDLFWLSTSKRLTDAEARKALAEYRSTGGMVDVVMAEPNAADPLDDSACYVGPTVEEIDWAGFEAVL